MSKKLLYISISFGSITFIVITYCIFFYCEVGDNNKWSTFFSFISTFSIFVAIIAFLNDMHLRKKEENEKKLIFANSVMDEYSRIIDSIEKNSNAYHGMTVPTETNTITFNKFEGGYYVNDNGKIRCIKKIVTTLVNLKKDALVFDHDIYHSISGIERDVTNINDDMDLSCLSGNKYSIEKIKNLIKEMKVKHDENHRELNRKIREKYRKYL
ncbi:hypothetical protein WEU31_14000 [Morganella morganii]|uniref:hypothetical protein n=1 Tax=Morganella morganii TaxID=582 RepID=UPI0030D18A87